MHFYLLHCWIVLLNSLFICSFYITSVLLYSSPLSQQLENVDLSGVSCVSWDGGDGEWVNDGCEPVEVTPNYTICSCSHLSSFTLMENTSAKVCL